MKPKTKTLTHVREEMKAGFPFKITYCTRDETRGTGGKRETIDGCVMVQAKGGEERRTIRGTGGAGGTVSIVRNPKHYLHGTVNVQQRNNRITKIHWLLIEQFNGFQVIL